MELPQRYSYNPRWTEILWGALFFGAGSAFMAHKAAHNTAGLIINGIITLGPAGATAFYWVIAALGAMFVMVALLLTVRRLAKPQFLELGEDGLLLPHGFLQTRITRIAYADLKQVWEVQVSSQTFLYLTTEERRFSIAASLLPDKDRYVEVRDFLCSRVPH